MRTIMLCAYESATTLVIFQRQKKTRFCVIHFAVMSVSLHPLAQ
jgi:hypothetical protein